jgi:Icc protein
VASSYRGQNADQGVKSLLPVITRWRPHLILITGDLSEDASVESYARLSGLLRSLDLPLFVLPGNHDDKQVMQGLFERGPWNGPLSVQAGEWQIVLMNSSPPGRIDGEISDDDIQCVGRGIDASPSRPVLLALHHQPIAIGAPWIDRYMLTKAGPLLQLISAKRQLKAVVWGHVHQPFEATRTKTRFMACPSSAANSLPATQRFEPDPSGPACRGLLLHPGGAIETVLLRAKEH